MRSKIKKKQIKNLKIPLVPKDKMLHASISFALVLILALFIGLILASLAIIGLGITTLIWDQLGNGHADVWGFVADVTGVIIAFIVASYGGIG